jgi:hypothetical protein
VVKEHVFFEISSRGLYRRRTEYNGWKVCTP